MENGNKVVEEIDLDEIDDEQTLIEMLDATEDFDDRKLIRARLKEVQAINRAKRDEMLKKRENEREMMLRKKVQEADEHKRRTLQMYDQMAKSAPAGGKKVMNAEILRGGSDGGSTNSSSCSSPIPTAIVAPQRDLVEEAIRDRQKAADERKKKILAAYDIAQQSGPAGTERIVDFSVVQNVDVSDYVPNTPKPEESFCTFAMSGGIPKVVKAPSSNPGTPVSAKVFAGAPNFFKKEEPQLDAMERAIRERKREADERKRRTLAAYDMVAKSGECGPKVVHIQEFRDVEVPENLPPEPKYDPTVAFKGGVPILGPGARPPTTLGRNPYVSTAKCFATSPNRGR